MFWGLRQLPVCAGILPDMSKFWYSDIRLLVLVGSILVLVAWVFWLVDCHNMLHCSKGRILSLSHHRGHLMYFCFHNLAAGTALSLKRGWVLVMFLRSSGFPLTRPWHVKDYLSWYVRNTWYVFETKGKTEYWDIENIDQAVQENEVGIKSIPSV